LTKGKAKIPLTTNARLHRDLNRCDTYQKKIF
jgi:hypothetical protein